MSLNLRYGHVGKAIMRRTKGFTLIEVMIALVIMSILTAISYPAYINHVEKAKCTDAVGTLLTIATKQEKYHYNAGTYTDDMTDLGYDADPAVSPESLFQVDATLTDAGQNYILTATRQGVDDSNLVYGNPTLTSTGVKSMVGGLSSGLESCWD